MSELLNDEEFEELKASQIRRGDIKLPVIDRLIATVEYWRRERQQTAKDSVSVIDRYLKENARLKTALSISEELYVRANKENAKLKTQLDAALKRIEEME